MFLNNFYKNRGIYYYPGMPNDKLLLIKLKESIQITNFELKAVYFLHIFSKIIPVFTDNIIIDIDQSEWKKFQSIIKKGNQNKD